MKYFTSVFYWLGILYLFYRYPFQINSSTTSPTYADTPFILSVGKYLLFMLLYACWFIPRAHWFVYSKKPFIVYCTLLWWLYGVVLSIVSFCVGQGFFLVEMIFFFPLFFIPFYYRSLGFFEKDQFNSILNHLHSLFLISFFVLFVVNFIQVVLFLFLGRLPALAWKGSISVRFGSIFDDPNGFAIILSLFPFLYFGLRRFITKFIFVLMFLFCLLSTQSLTGGASVFMSFMILLFYRGFVLRERSSFNSFLLLSFLMLTSSVVVGVWFYSYVETFLLIKSGSIAEHAKSTLFMDDMTFYDYFIGEPLGPVAESTYFNMLANFGLFFLFLYVSIILYVIWQGLCSLAHAGSMIEKNIYSSLVCFVLCVSLSGVNLPMMSVFPVNYMFYFVCGFLLCFSYAES